MLPKSLHTPTGGGSELLFLHNKAGRTFHKKTAWDFGLATAFSIDGDVRCVRCRQRMRASPKATGPARLTQFGIASSRLLFFASMNESSHKRSRKGEQTRSYSSDTVISANLLSRQYAPNLGVPIAL
jgi:hypothetical protein